MAVRARVSFVCRVATLLSVLVVPGSAFAHAPCGRAGYRHACRISRNRTVRGFLPISQAYLERWYVIHVRAHIRLTLTIDDVENPMCEEGLPPGGGTITCGAVSVKLLDAQGAPLQAPLHESPPSSPQNNADHPVTLSASVRMGGVYYLEVGGYTNGEALPFTLRIRARPALLR